MGMWLVHLRFQVAPYQADTSPEAPTGCQCFAEKWYGCVQKQMANQCFGQCFVCRECPVKVIFISTWEVYKE